VNVPDGVHVLVVEDEPAMREMLQWALEDEGILVEIAIDGHEGIKFATRRRPALVVLDMSLPGLDGVGVGEALRSRYGAGLPILVVTAGGGAEEKARRIGAFAYLHKPFDIHLFIALVHDGLHSTGPTGLDSHE
jgi:DNA-binding response OmpR family regulator